MVLGGKNPLSTEHLGCRIQHGGGSSAALKTNALVNVPSMLVTVPPALVPTDRSLRARRSVRVQRGRAGSLGGGDAGGLTDTVMVW